ncbi:MAG: Do family serine endopeptidase [Synergistaceae bacterium]|jgi:serine protease Do|nr:Do family serine endopeptidase [Synergistaceae bacterium]
MHRNAKNLFFLLLAAAFLLPLHAATASPAPGLNGADSNPVVRIARDLAPAVVNIDVESAPRRSRLSMPFDDPFFKRFFGEEFERFSRSVPMKGRGSGFIVSKDGRILTNNHVVSGAEKITVTMSDGKTYKAEVLGKDPTFDLAVIKIKPDRELKVLELGDSDAVEVGEWVVAIGNPFGFEHTVTVGVISAKNRSVHAQNIDFDGFLQTDAAINPGNSGGPLLDMEGRVVGINTAIIPYAQGIGFAIPVNMAKQIMNDLVSLGRVKRGWLGISVQDMTEEFAETYDVKEKSGVVVGSVVEGSAADKAGLKRGDVILEVGEGEQPPKTAEDVRWFVNKIRSMPPGTKAKIVVSRKGKNSGPRERVTLTATLSEMPESEGTLTEKDVGSSESAASSLKHVGITVSDITPAVARRFNLDKSAPAVVIVDVDPGSPAQESGVRAGDVILEAGGKKVKDVASLALAVKKDAAVVLLIERDGGASSPSRTFFVSLKGS